MTRKFRQTNGLLLPPHPTVAVELDRLRSFGRSLDIELATCLRRIAIAPPPIAAECATAAVMRARDDVAYRVQQMIVLLDAIARHPELDHTMATGTPAIAAPATSLSKRVFRATRRTKAK